jgi:hypothetical protein
MGEPDLDFTDSDATQSVNRNDNLDEDSWTDSANSDSLPGSYPSDDLAQSGPDAPGVGVRSAPFRTLAGTSARSP